jgi:DNA-binding MarR family transcriptional regulator
MSIDASLPTVLRTWVEVYMHRSFRDFRRFMNAAGLSASQVGTLMRLHYTGTCGVSDIGQHLGISVAAASQLVDRLVGQGYLQRTEDQADRRFKQVSLTHHGNALIENGIKQRQIWMEQITNSLSPQDQTTICNALTLLTQAALSLDSDSTGGSDDRLNQPPDPDHTDRI